MTSIPDLCRAAEHLATGPHAKNFLAGVVWPVAKHEAPGHPWWWIVERAGICSADEGLDLERAARLLLCRLPRGHGSYRQGSIAWAGDVQRIENATGARSLVRLLELCSSPEGSDRGALGEG